MRKLKMVVNIMLIAASFTDLPCYSQIMENGSLKMGGFRCIDLTPYVNDSMFNLRDIGYFAYASFRMDVWKRHGIPFVQPNPGGSVRVSGTEWKWPIWRDIASASAGSVANAHYWRGNDTPSRVNDGGNESDIIDASIVFCPAECLATTIVPLSVNAIGIDNDEAFSVGDCIHSRALCHLLGISAATAMQHEDNRLRINCRSIWREMDKIGSFSPLKSERSPLKCAIKLGPARLGNAEVCKQRNNKQNHNCQSFAMCLMLSLQLCPRGVIRYRKGRYPRLHAY